MSHQSEFKPQLVAVLEADATLTALLSSATAIYYRRPAQSVEYPALIYSLETEYAQETNRPGVRRLTLTIGAAGDDPDALDAIEEALRSVLDEAQSSLSTTNWRCGKCRLLRSTQSGIEHTDPDSHELLLLTSTTWDVWLYEK